MNFFEATMALGQAETLDLETAELLIRVENSGDVLYNALAERLDNEEAAELLRKNGREEVGHARRMMKVISLKTGTKYVPPPRYSRSSRSTCPIPSMPRRCR